MADFYGVPGSSSASGYLVVNGNVYPAVSGSNSLGRIPEGNYTYGGAETLSNDQWTMSNAKSKGEFQKNKKKYSSYKKFHIWGTGPGTPIYDKRLKKNRVGIEFHYDGGPTGTAGCIGYQDVRAKDDLIAARAAGDNSAGVHYSGNMDQVKAAIEKKLGHKVDWSKVKAPRSPGGGGGGGQRSKTRRGKKIKRGNRSVLAGRRRLHTAHLEAPLEGGGKVVEGSGSVFVGPERYKVAGVEHSTDDGSPIGNGEETVLFT